MNLVHLTAHDLIIPTNDEQLMNDIWDKTPEVPVLDKDEIHLWQIRLDAIRPSHLSACASLLSPEEQAKADRFRRSVDQERYTYTRGALRLLLGAYIPLPPHDIHLVYGPHGKPQLAPECGSLQFNVSHSGDIALAAFCTDAPVGVDVEWVRDDAATEQIAARYFSRNERVWLGSLPQDEQAHGFFRLWTRKEALLKAQGHGLWGEIERTEVVEAPRGWSLTDIEIGTLYCAAIASPGNARDIRRCRWLPEDGTATA